MKRHIQYLLLVPSFTRKVLLCPFPHLAFSATASVLTRTLAQKADTAYVGLGMIIRKGAVCYRVIQPMVTRLK